MKNICETYMQQMKLCTGNMERVLGEKREKMGQSLLFPQKIRSLGIDTISNAIFYENSIKSKAYNC